MQALELQTRLRNIAEELLGRQVAAKKATAFEPSAAKPAAVAIYGTESGPPLGLVVCELTLAAHLGAALSMMPAGAAETAARSKKLDGNLLENFQEVCNIWAQLFTESREERVVLQRIEPSITQLPAALKPPAVTVSLRADATLEIDRYGGGAISARILG